MDMARQGLGCLEHGRYLLSPIRGRWSVMKFEKDLELRSFDLLERKVTPSVLALRRSAALMYKKWTDQTEKLFDQGIP